MTSVIVAAISKKLAGLIASRSTTSGMIDRKNTITLGLPSVSDSEPENARQPRVAREGGAAALERRRRARHAPGDKEEIGDAGEFQRDEHAGEFMRDHRQARRRDRQPDEIADDIARDERRDPDEAVRENARDQRRHAGARRGDSGEVDRGEQQQRRNGHAFLFSPGRPAASATAIDRSIKTAPAPRGQGLDAPPNAS